MQIRKIFQGLYDQIRAKELVYMLRSLMVNLNCIVTIVTRDTVHTLHLNLYRHLFKNLNTNNPIV